MSALPNLLMFGAVAGLGYMIYTNSSSKDDESDSAGNTLSPSASGSSFAQTSSQLEAYQGWTERFSTSCGWHPIEEDCPTKDCIDTCSRLIAQTNMNLESGVSTDCLDRSGTPDVGLWCATAPQVHILGSGGDAMTVRAVSGAPIQYNDRTFEFYIDLQVFTDCDKVTGPNNWAYSHFGEVSGTDHEIPSQMLTFTQTNLMNPEGLALTTENFTILQPAYSDYQNIEDGTDCREYRYNTEDGCGGYTRYTFKVKPQSYTEADRLVGAFSLSMKIRLERDSTDCDFDEMYDITIPNFVFILPADCRDNCASLGMGQESNFNERKIVSYGNGYRITEEQVDIPQWIEDMHRGQGEDPSTYDTYTPVYAAESYHSPSIPLTLVSRNSYISF